MGSTIGRKKNKNTKSKDYISWFEIPAVNFDQAVTFYNHIFGVEMKTLINSDYAVAFFPSEGGIGGSIVSNSSSMPSEAGPLLYLNGGDDLDNVLEKVPEAGGRIIMTKTFIDKDSGYFAVFIDSEGNKLALHSKK
jgi:predicted enzyme related to lactoylglutathione lyase